MEKKPVCEYCKKGYSTFKIGKYVFHVLPGAGNAGCEVANKLSEDEKDL